MRRIPIQFDDATHAMLREKAFAENRSIASIVRECVAKKMSPLSMSDFTFVGSGRSRQQGPKPVSADHDAALAAALTPRRRR